MSGDFINGLNKILESRVRLGIMSVLLVNDEMDFNSLKEYLKVTDGNLASHILALERAGYVEVEKKFIGKKPNTTYYVTRAGKKAFTDHLNSLEKFLKKHS